MFCKRHDTVGCVTCIDNDHRSCPSNQVYSVPGMIQILFNLSNSDNTRRTLQQKMVVLASLGKSKDDKLEALNAARQETLSEVATLLNTLIAILQKMADSSREEVEEAYTKLEREVLREKGSIDTINAVIEELDNKLNEAAANRAQRFVCTDVAKKTIEESEKIEDKLKDNKDDIVLFLPNQSLIDTIQACQSIGKVEISIETKNDLYKLARCSDLNVRIPDDLDVCNCYGLCLIDSHQLLVTDSNNKKLKLFDILAKTLVDYSVLDSAPVDVCSISKQEVAVAFRDAKKIELFSLQNNKIKPSRSMAMDHVCYGISMKDDKLYVTDRASCLYVYDMNGFALETIPTDTAVNKLFNASRYIAFSKTLETTFVSDWDNGLVCLDGDGHSIVSDHTLGDVSGVCADNRGNVFVAGCRTGNVVQFTEDGKKIGVVLGKLDGLNRPWSLCFHKETNRLFVTSLKDNIVKMYELE